MPTYNYPGVYIEEKPGGPGPIRGVSPSAMGLIGWTDRGPVNYPTICTSFPEYAQKFGSFTANGLSPTMAYAFYANGGGELYQVRVTHDDAVNSWSDLVYEINSLTPEFVGDTVEPSGLYVDTLGHSPISPGTVQITFEAAGTDNVFTDPLGDGALTATGGGGSGGSGSIDYATGDFSIQLTVPGDYAGGADDILAVYTYRIFRFEMAWPGVQGDFFRVVVSGSPDYLVSGTASYSRYDVVVEEDVAQDPTAPAWNTRETFEALNLSDPTDPNFISTVMNDVIYGSSIVTVTSYGNEMNPEDLNGVHIGGSVYAAEDFSATQVHSDGSSLATPDAYDGAWKGWTYEVNAPGSMLGVFPTTFFPQYWFTEAGLRIGIGASPAAEVPILTWSPAAIVAGTLTGQFTLTVLGLTTFTSNLAGDLFVGAVVVGSVVWTTGVIAIDTTVLGDTIVANSAVTISCTYAEPVTLNDDGNGNLFVADPTDSDTPGGPYSYTPTKFVLDGSGVNTVDYDTGEFTATWKISGNPAAGPSGVSGALGPQPASKSSSAGPWSLTPGAVFTLAVDAVGAAPVTFNATAGYQVDTTGYAMADQDGNNFTIQLNGGVVQTITFSGVTTSVTHVVDQVNPQLIGGYAYDDGGQLRVVSDIFGTDSSVLMAAGTSALTFAAAVAGTGNVGDITAVTAAEYKTIVELATTADVTDNGDGTQTTEGIVTGVTGLLTFGGEVPAGTLAALGITAPLTVNGTAASTTDGEVADYYTNPDTTLVFALANGDDGSALDSGDIVDPSLSVDGNGLWAFGKADAIMNLVAADFQTDPYVDDALLTYADLMKDKFVIMTYPHGLDPQEAVNWKKFTLAKFSSRGALYGPHIKIKDPVTDSALDVPCGGHVAGVYARTDALRNVGEAPAGMQKAQLNWLLGLEQSLDRENVGILNRANINALVDWSQTGRCVWGARTIAAAGSEWGYLQARRLFTYVEKSVFNATHIHVFENNGPTLWSRIRMQVTNFLKTLHDQGYFAGTTAAESFFVTCDSTNNPQATVDMGIVFCDVGLAPNKPAEFVVFRFQQKSL